MPNIKYDKEKVIEIILEYFFLLDEKRTSMPFEKLYAEIVEYASLNHQKVKMPTFSQARKMIISEFELQKGEKVTSKNVYNIIKNNYYNDENIADVLINEYDLSVYFDTPIICTIKLPPVEQLDVFAKVKSEKNKKSVEWGRINFIQNLCRKIKRKNENILAVIPEFNRMIYLNKDGKNRQKRKEFQYSLRYFMRFHKK